MIEDLLENLFTFLFMIVLLMLAVGVYYVAHITWPIFPLFAISAIAWWFLRKRTAVWSKALAQVLLPVTIGLFILFVCLFILNVSESSVAADDIRAVEKTLIQLKISLKEWARFSLPVFVALLASLVVLSHLISGSKLVTRFFRLQKIVSSLVIVLTTITTFTFFSQYPIDGWAAKEQERKVGLSNVNIRQYEMLLREERDKLGKFLAEKSLKRAIRDMTDEDKRNLEILFQTINQIAANVPSGVFFIPQEESSLALGLANEVPLKLQPRESPQKPRAEGVIVQQYRKMMGEHRIHRSKSLLTSEKSVANELPHEALPKLHLQELSQEPEAEEITLDLRTKVVKDLAKQHIEEIVRGLGIHDWLKRFGARDGDIYTAIARRDLDAELIEHQPTSKQEWQVQNDRLAEQTAQLGRLTKRTNQIERLVTSDEGKVAGAKLFSETIKKTIEPMFPGFEGFAGVFIDTFVSNYSEPLYENMIIKWGEREHKDSNLQGVEFAAFVEASVLSSNNSKRLLVPSVVRSVEGLENKQDSRAEIGRYMRSVMLKIDKKKLKELGQAKLRELEASSMLRPENRRGITSEPIDHEYGLQKAIEAQKRRMTQDMLEESARRSREDAIRRGDPPWRRPLRPLRLVP